MTWPPTDLASAIALLAPSALATSMLSWVALAAAAVYVFDLIVARRRGRPFPAWRVTCFLLGCVILFGVTGTGVETLARALFSVFMFQQLTLMIVVPSLLVLGAPVVLLLRSGRRGPIGQVRQRWALGATRSRAAGFALHPLVDIGVFLAAYYGLYLSGLAQLVLRTPLGDLGLELFFLAAGLLFAVPVFSGGRLPRRVTHAERAIDLFIEMALHAFFGVLVMISTSLLIPAFADSSRALGVDPLADQGIAGGLAWSYGEGPAVLTLLFVMERWFRSDARTARRAEASGDTSTAAELAAYNEYLARLAGRDRG